MALTEESVRRAARLARLDLTESEIRALTAGLSDIIAHADRLADCDTSAVQPLIHVADGRCNIVRADEPAPGLSEERALAAAPARQDNHFLVPPVMDSE